MMDMVCVVFVRDKTPTIDMIELAEESGIVILSTSRLLITRQLPMSKMRRKKMRIRTTATPRAL